MGGVLLKAQHTLNLHIFSMSTCHEYLSFVPHSPSLFSFLSVQNNRRFERIALRNGRKREAHKEVLLCIPSSIPTPSSPLLFLSALFFSSSPPSSCSGKPCKYDVIWPNWRAFDCTFWICNPANVGINQKCMSCSLKTDSICNTEGQREGKSKRKRQTEHKCKPGK